MIVLPLMVSITMAKTRDGWRFASHLALMIESDRLIRGLAG